MKGAKRNESDEKRHRKKQDGQLSSYGGNKAQGTSQNMGQAMYLIITAVMLG